ncbi:MarC family protein [Moraxella atlantae]|uniref:UPF0056 membrane protein n=1 Tax=Faucicola atlantae TaxID=34059 RepID=A0A1B8QEP1_9GAMM|nr:MarC family protein [Moraxella atlantae]OBX80167.1 hypothetical protein A9306_07960 [Moraxella atlantae]OPH36457.1 hypothetical protein B5J92_03555 [Moraxella atlantae]STY96172.1 membrane protein, MarC family [Moraxella atlantae]
MDGQVLKIFFALIVLVNPISALPMFISITEGATSEQARKVALISAATVLITVMIFAVAGELILKVFGISLGSFRVAGGLLVLLIAIGMMNGAGNIAKPSEDSDELSPKAFMGTSAAIVPLTIPMIIGPGGISTVIIYAAQGQQTGQGYKATLAIITAGLLISVFTFLSFSAARQVSRFLGDTGINVLNRVMGMLLAALAVEIIVAGLRTLFPQLV